MPAAIGASDLPEVMLLAVPTFQRVRLEPYLTGAARGLVKASVFRTMSECRTGCPSKETTVLAVAVVNGVLHTAQVSWDCS